MNSGLLKYLTVLALTATSFAAVDGDQTLLTKSPPGEDSTSTSAPRFEANGTLHLSAGSLPDVVAQIEQFIPKMNEQGGTDWSMPNVIFDEQARNLRVPADLRLRKVTPVQAVALVAAAAGCALEPIAAPNETPSVPGGPAASPPQTIVGYRILAGRGQPKHDDLSGIGISLVSKDGVVTVGDVYPNTPAARSGRLNPGDRLVSIAERGNPPVLLEGMPAEKVAKLIRGAAGSTVELQVQSDSSEAPVSVPITREKMPLPGPAWPSHPSVHVVTPAGGETLEAPQAGANPIVPLLPAPTTPPPLSPANPYSTFANPADATAPAVRVYAVGSLFKGTEDEALEKEKAFRELVASALEKADPSQKSQPTVSFHSRSKALIVKGTPSQHAVIKEILAALKENQTSEAPPPTIRRF